MLSRMSKKKVEKIDYLTPQRQARQHQESLKGDYSVDFKQAWQKAKVKSSITTKQSVYLTHLRDDRSLSLLTKVEDVKSSET